MFKRCQRFLLAAIVVLATAGTALAQAPASGSTSGGWDFTIYPILAWVPLQIDIETNLPPVDGGGSGGGGNVNGGKIVDSRLDGAYLGGFSATNGTWRIDTDAVWAAVGGDRAATPRLKVDVDLIYGHGTVGRKIAKDFYVTGGVRRMALKFDVVLGDRPNFERKPGVWDPVVGVAYHKIGKKLELHALFEGGGFGVGTDSEYAGSARFDWKPVSHFGITAGYSFLNFKLSDELLGKTLEAKQTLSGPVVGIGLYF